MYNWSLHLKREREQYQGLCDSPVIGLQPIKTGADLDSSTVLNI